MEFNLFSSEDNFAAKNSFNLIDPLFQMASIPLEPCLEQAMDTGILKKGLVTSKTLFSEQNPELFFKSE